MAPIPQRLLPAAGFALWPEGTVSTAKEAGFAKASALGKKQQILNTPWEIERISTTNA
jgi:hypothetical protein